MAYRFSRILGLGDWVQKQLEFVWPLHGKFASAVASLICWDHVEWTQGMLETKRNWLYRFLDRTDVSSRDKNGHQEGNEKCITRRACNKRKISLGLCAKNVIVLPIWEAPTMGISRENSFVRLDWFLKPVCATVACHASFARSVRFSGSSQSLCAAIAIVCIAKVWYDTSSPLDGGTHSHNDHHKMEQQFDNVVDVDCCALCNCCFDYNSIR